MERRQLLNTGVFRPEPPPQHQPTPPVGGGICIRRSFPHWYWSLCVRFPKIPTDKPGPIPELIPTGMFTHQSLRRPWDPVPAGLNCLFEVNPNLISSLRPQHQVQTPAWATTQPAFLSSRFKSAFLTWFWNSRTGFGRACSGPAPDEMKPFTPVSSSRSGAKPKLCWETGSRKTRGQRREC